MTKGRSLCIPLAFSLAAALSCKRLGDPSAEDASSPQIVTTVGRTIEYLEAAQQRANEHHRQRSANGAQPTKPLLLARTKLEAAARGRFAQVLWSARFLHGQKAKPRTRVGQGIIRCEVELTGDPDANGGTDWVEYTTKVPEKFTP